MADVDFNSKRRNAMVAGGCFIAVCIFMLTIPSINKAAEIFTIRLVALVVPLALFAAALIAHFQGYVHLGRQYGSVLLTRSSQLIMTGLAFFELAVIISIFAAIAHAELEVQLANAAIGLFVAFLLIPAVLFAVAIVRMYKEFGISTIAAACIVPVAILSMWQPWPAALVVGASVYLFYRISSLA